jgi:hypothetical protein
MDTMRDLLKKYPLGYEGYLLEKGLGPAVDPAAANAAAVEANRGIEVLGIQGTNTAGEGQGGIREFDKQTTQADEARVQS